LDYQAPPAVQSHISHRLFASSPPAASPLNLSKPPSQSYIGPAIIDDNDHCSGGSSLQRRPSSPTICVDDDEDAGDDDDEDEGCSSPEPPTAPRFGVKYDGGGINVTTKPSKTNSIRIVLQREHPSEDYSIREVLIKDGSQAAVGGANQPPAIEPQAALQALKIKARISKRLDSKVEAFTVPLYHHTEESFANEEVVGGGSGQAEEEKSKDQPWRPRVAPAAAGRFSRPEPDVGNSKDEEGRPRIVYNVAAADGSFQTSGSDITVLWQKERKPPL
jgi:hypothetical protein